jgi:Na+-transporting NADH:ubiquinone oxidoreductase subunit NqrB
MSVLASADTKTLWEVALGVGLVVILVVIALMALLLSFIKDIEAGTEILVTTAGELAENTAAIPELATTASVLEDIKAEALVHHDYLAGQLGSR